MNKKDRSRMYNPDIFYAESIGFLDSLLVESGWKKVSAEAFTSYEKKSCTITVFGNGNVSMVRVSKDGRIISSGKCRINDVLISDSIISVGASEFI